MTTTVHKVVTVNKREVIIDAKKEKKKRSISFIACFGHRSCGLDALSLLKYTNSIKLVTV